jgi:hypothetical protein
VRLAVLVVMVVTEGQEEMVDRLALVVLEVHRAQLLQEALVVHFMQEDSLVITLQLE